MKMSHLPIIELDIVDSTNNYAMQLIDADKAQHGLTITARTQTGGKGQRGRSWTGEPGKSLLMSIITDPKLPITDQFVFNALVAVVIADLLAHNYNIPHTYIKWPNDIIVGDKKAGGILIENIIRGSRWAHSVIGLGLNVGQEHFPAELPYATSLLIATGSHFDVGRLCVQLSENITAAVSHPPPADVVMKRYNEYLYKKGAPQGFHDDKRHWQATILNARPDGTLQVQLSDDTLVCYHHGQALWDWDTVGPA